jgi:hypothetical protein
VSGAHVSDKGLIYANGTTHAYFGANSAAGSDAGILMSEAGTFKWAIINDGDDADKLVIQGDGGGADKFMVIDQTGNLGIGTTSPDHILHIDGGGLCIDNASGDCGSMTQSVGSATTTGSLWVEGDARVVGTLDSSDIQFHNLNNEVIWTITEGDRVGLNGDELVFKNASGTPQFVLTQNGVGIATTTPTNVLTIGQGMGNAIADGWSVYSSREYKTNIVYLEEQDYEDILEDIEKMNLARYRWKKDVELGGVASQDLSGDLSGTSTETMLGVIAEEAPQQVKAADGKSISLYDYASYALAGVKAVKGELDKLKSVLGVVENEDGTLSMAGEESSVEPVIIKGINGQEYQLVLDVEGFVVLDKVRTRELEIVSGGKMTMPSGVNEIMGEGTIEVGSNYGEVKNSLITRHSKIFISFTANLGGNNWWICEKKPGEYFRVCLSHPSQNLIGFDYWIIQTKEIEPPAVVEDNTVIEGGSVGSGSETSTTTESDVVGSDSNADVVNEGTATSTEPVVGQDSSTTDTSVSTDTTDTLPQETTSVPSEEEASEEEANVSTSTTATIQ